MKSEEAAVTQSFHLFGAFAETPAGATEKEASCHSTGERSDRWPFAAEAHSRRLVFAMPFVFCEPLCNGNIIYAYAVSDNRSLRIEGAPCTLYKLIEIAHQRQRTPHYWRSGKRGAGSFVRYWSNSGQNSISARDDLSAYAE